MLVLKTHLTIRKSNNNSMKLLSQVLITSFLFTWLTSCEQPDPKFGIRTGDSLFFADRYWEIKKYETSLMGPGPNYFSTDPNHVWVDTKGRLHMTISNRDGRWFATEVVSTDTMGYGTYTFTVLGDLVNIPENITLGLFTWDNNTFLEEANSEVDIEFSKWGDTSSNQTLHYAVQPVAFGPVFEERMENAHVEDFNVFNGTSTHQFTWTPNKITWSSYRGEKVDDKQQIASWEFDDSNPARIKYENGVESKPIVIPKPGRTTNTRINFWVQTWINIGPSDGEEYEIMVTDFRYKSL